MKKTRRISIALILSLVVSMTAATSVVSAASKPAKMSVAISAKTIDIGGTASITAKVSNKTSKAVTFKSSNKKIVKVSSKGVVTGVKSGSARITVTSKLNKKLAKTVKVSVKNLKAMDLSFDSEELEVIEGTTEALKLTIKGPKTLNTKGVKWTSSEKSIVEVDQKGNVSTKFVYRHNHDDKRTESTVTASLDGKTATIVIKPVAPAEYNTISAKRLHRDLIANKAQYVILDTRSATGGDEDMQSFDNQHIVRSISTPLPSAEDSATYVNFEDAKKMMASAGVDPASDEKYVVICWFGGEWAQFGATVLRSMGVDEDNILILDGGIWGVDPYWIDIFGGYSMADYLVKQVTSKGGVVGDGVTAEQVHNDLDASMPIYTVLDVRSSGSYAEGHIRDSVSASIEDASNMTEEEKDNFRKIVKKNPSNTIYTLVCYSGNAYADAAQKELIELGVPAENIVRLIDGYNGYSTVYPGDIAS